MRYVVSEDCAVELNGESYLLETGDTIIINEGLTDKILSVLKNRAKKLIKDMSEEQVIKLEGAKAQVIDTVIRIAKALDPGKGGEEPQEVGEESVNESLGDATYLLGMLGTTILAVPAALMILGAYKAGLIGALAKGGDKAVGVANDLFDKSIEKIKELVGSESDELKRIKRERAERDAKKKSK